jgi:hypothetical protein
MSWFGLRIWLLQGNGSSTLPVRTINEKASERVRFLFSDRFIGRATWSFGQLSSTLRENAFPARAFDVNWGLRDTKACVIDTTTCPWALPV